MIFRQFVQRPPVHWFAKRKNMGSIFFAALTIQNKKLAKKKSISQPVIVFVCNCSITLVLALTILCYYLNLLLFWLAICLNRSCKSQTIKKSNSFSVLSNFNSGLNSTGRRFMDLKSWTQFHIGLIISTGATEAFVTSTEISMVWSMGGISLSSETINFCIKRELK